MRLLSWRDKLFRHHIKRNFLAIENISASEPFKNDIGAKLVVLVANASLWSFVAGEERVDAGLSVGRCEHERDEGMARRLHPNATFLEARLK